MSLFLLALAAAAPAGPVDTPDRRYRACLASVRSSPTQAVGQAQAWLGSGGGIMAAQCLGLAQAALERWTEAATAFEAAAKDATNRDDRRRGDLWAQAGNSWLAAGDATRARTALQAALASGLLTGGMEGEVRLDLARAAVALGDLGAARGEIDKALKAVPGDGFAWYLSAALARRQKDLARAQQDIAHAVSLAPDDAAILLEAGNIAGVSGEPDAARGLYARAARAQPRSEAGRAAKAALDEAGEGTPAAEQPPQPR